MCKFIGKSNERILCKLNKSEILRLYSIIHVAMETTKTSSFTRQSKSFISIFFTCQVSTCELQPFSCHYLANEIYSQTAKTVFSHLNQISNEIPTIPTPQQAAVSKDTVGSEEKYDHSQYEVEPTSAGSKLRVFK